LYSTATAQLREMASLSAASSPAARRCYEVLACDAYEDMARRLSAAFPDRFTYHHSKCIDLLPILRAICQFFLVPHSRVICAGVSPGATFPDGSDNIELGGYSPVNQLRGKHVLFLAAFSDNSTTLSQFYALIVLLGEHESFECKAGSDTSSRGRWPSNSSYLSCTSTFCVVESFIESLTVVLPFYPTGTMERVVKEGQIATASTLARIFNTLPSYVSSVNNNRDAMCLPCVFYN